MESEEESVDHIKELLHEFVRSGQFNTCFKHQKESGSAFYSDTLHKNKKNHAKARKIG